MDTVHPADPASKAARAVVRRHLDAAASGAERLSDPDDLEALHDCRVALRRLRVALKAYGPLLRPGVPKDLRKAVSALAEQTGPARDAEVFVMWLTPRVRRLRPTARGAAEWLLRTVASRRDAEYKRLRTLIPKALALIEPLLRAGLAARAAPAGPGEQGRSFGAFTAVRVEEQIADLLAELGKVRTADDHERVHRARIAAKKVRYLLEAALTERGASILKPLKRVQDLLGEFHDLGCVHEQVARARRGRGQGRPSQRSLLSLGAVDRIAERERRLRFGRIRRLLLQARPLFLAPVQRWVRRQANARAGYTVRRPPAPKG